MKDWFHTKGGGITFNACVGSWGHWEDGDWGDDGALEAEAFAHMFEAQFDKSKYNATVFSTHPKIGCNLIGGDKK